MVRVPSGHSSSHALYQSSVVAIDSPEKKVETDADPLIEKIKQAIKDQEIPLINKLVEKYPEVINKTSVNFFKKVQMVQRYYMQLI